MKIVFNDGQELTVQDVKLQTDGGLLIKTISGTEEQLKEMFSNETATKKITVSERGSQVSYENYTQMDAIVKYAAGILGVVLYKVGETVEEMMNALIKENEALKEKTEMLEGCILEMSEKVYE